jgi:peroxiredoxin
MKNNSLKKLFKVAGYAVLLVAVGIGGVFVGHIVRDRLPGRQKPMGTMSVPVSLLRVDTPFPDVPLVGPDGEIAYTGSLAGDGSVVLFLDLDCAPCDAMSARWQAAYDADAILPGRLWGVTYFPRHVIERYAREHDLDFPIYVDSLRTFHTQYEVNRFPLEVVVGSSGLIRSTSYDSESPVEIGRVFELMSR